MPHSDKLVFIKTARHCRVISGCLFFVFFLLVTQIGYGQASFNSNVASGNWESAGTWLLTSGSDVDGIPDADDDVIILSGHVVFVSDGLAPASVHACRNATIDNGGTLRSNSGSTVRTLNVANNLTVSTGGTLEVNNVGSATHFINIGGNFVVDGTFTPVTGSVSVTITFNGGGAQSITGSVSPVNFANLVVSKGGGTLFTGGSVVAINAANITNTLGDFIAPATVTTSSGFTLTSGTYTAGATTNVGGNFSMNGGTFTGGADTNVGGNFAVNAGTFAAGAEVTFNGTGTQIISAGAPLAFNNLTTSSSTSVIVTGQTTVGVDLTIGNGTSFTISTADFAVTGSTNIGSGVSGAVVISSGAGTKTFSGLVTINSGGSWNNTANAPITFRGGITNAGTFAAGTGINTFDSTAPFKTLAGTFSIPRVTISGSNSLINTNTLSVSTELTGPGSIVQGAGSTLNVGGIFNVTSVDASTNANNTVNYNGSSQTVRNITYRNLSISQSSGEAILGGTGTIVNGVLTLNTGRLNLGGFQLILGSSASIGGAPSVSNMIIATGGGEVIKNALSGPFTFPIGDNSGMFEYSPITVDVTVGSPNITVSVADTKHPNNASSTNFISRYWNVSSSANTTVNITGVYDVNDVNGANTAISPAQLRGVFNQTSNGWNKPTVPINLNPTLSYLNSTLNAGQLAAYTGITFADPVVNMSPDVTICSGTSIMLSASGVGDPTFSYSWAADPSLSSTTISNPVATPTANTTYTVTAYDGNGIQAMNSVTVTVDLTPVVASGQVKTICSGSAVNLKVLLTPAGMPAGTVYNWAAPTMSSGPAQGTAGVNVPESNALTITDVLTNTTGSPITATYNIIPTGPAATNCVGASVPVVITIEPVPVIAAGQVKTICSGSAVNLKVLLTPAGMPAGTVYDWAAPTMSSGPAQGTAGVSVPESNALTITDVLTNTTGSPITATYNIIPTGPGTLNCVGASIPVVITIDPSPVVVAGQVKTICSGSAVNLKILLARAGMQEGTF